MNAADRLTRPQVEALRSVGRHRDLSRGQDGRTSTAVIRRLQAMGLVMVNPHTPRPGGWTAALTENGKRKLTEISGSEHDD